MNEMMDSMDMHMERFIMERELSPIKNHEFRGPLCVEKAQTTLEHLQEHTVSPLMVEKKEDKQLKSTSPPHLASHEEYIQQEEGNYLPLCFASFDFLRQRLKVSNPT